jgi:MFS family permease
MRSRTFVALLIAQFLAAFNDQAIHASAMFFALNQHELTEKQAIALMPILFYAPWAIFCTLAGYLADRYSKRTSLVFWKFAEVAICAVALFGFYLGDTYGLWQGPWIVLGTVFLMGMHSAFFVPAKYGVMPEILPPHELAKGNGLLESLSFLAVILGTVSGGILSFLFVGQETIIGIILLMLAVVGAIASLFIHQMPAANPTLQFPPWVYGPLWNSLKTLVRIPGLWLTVIGLAFFTFNVAYMRQAVYMLGESQNPRWDELKTSMVVGAVALGIGVGSPLAGFCSGRKIELGLILLGGLGMMASMLATAALVGWMPGLVLAIVLIGFSTGFYIVPLFTLLQHRAPKSGKGDTIATSNFVNISGAILASLFFFGLVTVMEKTGVGPTLPQTLDYATGTLTRLETVRGRAVFLEVTAANDATTVIGYLPDRAKLRGGVVGLIDHLAGTDEPTGPRLVIDMDKGIADLKEGVAPQQVILDQHELRGVTYYYLRPTNAAPRIAHDYQRLPPYLFAGAAGMTLLAVCLLIWSLPDLPARALHFLAGLFRPGVEVSGLGHVPSEGPLVLLHTPTDSVGRGTINSALDRYTHFVPLADVDKRGPDLQRWLSKGHILAISATREQGAALEAFLRQMPATTAVVPVFYGTVTDKCRLVFAAPMLPTNQAGELFGQLEAAAQVTADEPLAALGGGH